MARGRIRIEKETLERLQSERDRTGAGPAALLSGKRNHFPYGFSAHLLDGWLRGRINSARPEHLDFVFAEYAKLSAAPALIELDEALIAKLRAEFERSGETVDGLLRRNRADIPYDLSGQIIRRWLRGATKQARQDHIQFVLEALNKARPR